MPVLLGVEGFCGGGGGGHSPVCHRSATQQPPATVRTARATSDAPTARPDVDWDARLLSGECGGRMD